MKNSLPIIIIAILVALIIMAAPYTSWEQCSICGVQRYERGLLKTRVDSWSVDEFDEYGTYAQWKELHNATNCAHHFEDVEHKTPIMKLEELNQQEQTLDSACTGK